MAENKKSFLFYVDWKQVFDELENEDAGKLIKHVLSYVADEDPEPLVGSLKIAYIPIKLQLKRDLVSWAEKKFGKSNSGHLGNLKRWNKDLYDKVLTEEIELNEALEIAKGRKASQKVANIAVNVTVTDTVTVNDTVKVNAKSDFIEMYFNDLENSTDFESICRVLKVEPDFLKTFIPAFRLKAELSYKDFSRFTNHFKNYVLKQIENATTKTKSGDRISRQESVNQLEELSLKVLGANDSLDSTGSD